MKDSLEVEVALWTGFLFQSTFSAVALGYPKNVCLPPGPLIGPGYRIDRVPITASYLVFSPSGSDFGFNLKNSFKKD
jgi:hypothetical protein